MRPNDAPRGVREAERWHLLPHLAQDYRERNVEPSKEPVPWMLDISAILIVEDNPTDAMLLKQAFKRAQFKGLVQEVGTADLAYKWLVERLDAGLGLPELVLLDLGLPEETGMEMLAKLKGTPALSKMHIVVFSGSRRPKDMAQARDLGADWYFVKQATPRDLDFIVSELARICKESTV